MLSFAKNNFLIRFDLPGVTATRTCGLIIFLALYSAVFFIHWDGLGPRDAEKYAEAALRWNELGPYLGENHWSLRYLLVLPMVLHFAIFGPSEFGACLPNFIYGALLVSVTYYFGRRHIGSIEGNILTFLVAVSPFFTIQAGELRIYGVEIFYVVTSIFLLLEGINSRPANSKFIFAAGLFGGGAWLCRESTIFLPLMIAAAIMITRAPFFRTSIIAGLGYLTVVLSELAFYQIAAGNTFYRYKIDMGHGEGKPSTEVGGPAPEQSIFSYIIHPFRELFTYPTVTPLVIIAVLSLFFLLRVAPPKQEVRRILAIFVIGSALSFFISGYFLSLEYVEYYPIICFASLIVIAITCAAYFQKFGTLSLALTLIFLVVLGFGGADFRDYDEYNEARLLADYAEQYNEPIFSDRLTVVRAKMLVRLRGASEEEAEHLLRHDQLPTAGMLAYKATSAGVKYGIADESNWIEIERSFPRGPSWTKYLLRKIVPASAKQGRVSEILRPPNPAVLYRIPEVGVVSEGK